MSRIHIDESVIHILDTVSKAKIEVLFTKRVYDAKKKIDLKKISEIYNLDFEKITFNEQIHSDIVRNIKRSDISTVDKADSLVTSEYDVGLLAFTADCVPIVLYDEKNIAVAHCGWRGTYSLLAKKTLEQMIENGSKKENIKVVIGPAIGVCCYEVGDDLADKFSNLLVDLNIESNECVVDVNGKYHLDLPRINKYILSKYGVLEENIINLDVCTSCNCDKYYSYRKDEGTSSRIGTIVVKKSI